jgi:hypothetical protein
VGFFKATFFKLWFGFLKQFHASGVGSGQNNGYGNNGYNNGGNNNGGGIGSGAGYGYNKGSLTTKRYGHNGGHNNGGGIGSGAGYGYNNGLLTTQINALYVIYYFCKLKCKLTAPTSNREILTFKSHISSQLSDLTVHRWLCSSHKCVTSAEPSLRNFARIV